MVNPDAALVSGGRFRTIPSHIVRNLSVFHGKCIATSSFSERHSVMPLTDRTVAELWQKIKTHLLTSRIKTITSASARGKTVNYPWHRGHRDGDCGAGLVVLTRNEETTDDAFTDGDVVTIAPKRQATLPNFACGITSA